MSVYTRWQHYKGCFHIAYTYCTRAFHSTMKHSMPFVCYYVVSWNMTGFLYHIRGHVLTLHHVIHTSLPMLYCRLQLQHEKGEGFFFSPAHHAVCCVPECDTIFFPCQWTGTIGIYITWVTSLSTNHDTLYAVNKSTTEVCKTTHVCIHSRCHSKTCILDSSDVHIHNHMSQKVLCATVKWETFEVKTELVKNTIFAEKTFTDCSLLPCQRMPRPQISQRNLSRIATKPRNSCKFSPLKVSCFLVLLKHSSVPVQHYAHLFPDIQ